jgi:hypothetical protein
MNPNRRREMPDLGAIFRKHLGQPEPPTGPDPPAAPAAAATPPEAAAPPEPPPSEAPPATRPGAMPGDPPAPRVHPDTSRSLTILELAGAGPHLTADGRLEITHPTRVTPTELAIAQLHQADIARLLRYRELLERLFQVTAEPMPPEDAP